MDAESLREQKSTRSIKAEKFAETVKKGETSMTIDDVVIGPREYEQYLWMAYKKGKFRKPANILGFTKKLPVPDMERSLRENTVITDGYRQNPFRLKKREPQRQPLDFKLE